LGLLRAGIRPKSNRSLLLSIVGENGASMKEMSVLLA
jgi:hypothetical protein